MPILDSLNLDKNGKPKGLFKFLNISMQIFVFIVMVYAYYRKFYIISFIMSLLILSDTIRYFSLTKKNKLEQDINKIKSKLKKA